MALDPATVALIARTGGSFFSSLFDDDPGEDVRQEGVSRLRRLSGKPVINVNRAIAQNRATQIPRIRRLGESVNKRFGFDTGRGQEALLTDLLESERKFNLGTGIKSDILTGQRDFNIASSLSRFRG